MVEWENFGRRYLHLYYFYISNNEFKYIQKVATQKYTSSLFGICSFVEVIKAVGKIPPIIRGLISFKWENEITPNNIKLLKKTLRNLARNLADSRIPAKQRIYDELGTMNIQTPSTFCTKVIHNLMK